MRTRFFISITTILISLSLLVVGLIFFDGDLKILSQVQFFYVLFLSLTYFIGSIPKLLIFFVYAVFYTILMYYFSYYRIGFIILAVFTFLFNPLSFLENKIRTTYHMKSDFSLSKLFNKKTAQYYEYRKKMKDYYHMPQVKKIYEKSYYFYLRYTVVAGLLVFATYLAFEELSSIALTLSVFDIDTAIQYYLVISAYTLAYLIYRKGFKSAFYVLTTLFLPLIIAILFNIRNQELYIQVISYSLIFVEIIVVIYQLSLYYRRVSYQSMEYYNTDHRRHTNFNLLYEDFLNNDIYSQIVRYEISISSTAFLEKINLILQYANFYKFYIISYDYSQNKSSILCSFTKQSSRISKFSNILTKIYKTEIKYDLISDRYKYLYETYISNDLYIIAKANILASLYREIAQAEEIILDLYFYFKNYTDVVNFSYEHKITINVTDQNLFYIKVREKLPNIEYVIELKIREILLNSLINEGVYDKIDINYQKIKESFNAKN